MKAVILLGSSRSHGNTRAVCQHLQTLTNCELIDLKPLNIGHYDYEYSNLDDDFLPLMRKIVSEYDTIIFATPVYWYSMSGIMKVFFDRITDCLKVEKELGDRLKAKNMALVSCSAHDDLDARFSMPFINTADYLDMMFLGEVHICVKDKEKGLSEVMEKRLADFWEEVMRKMEK